MEKEQQPNEQRTSTKPANSEPNIDQAEARESAFQLSDLSQLTWKQSDGHERDVWSSTAADFQTFVSQFGSVSNVDVHVWSVFDRLDYVNELRAFCQLNQFCFPFQTKPVEQPAIKREEVGT